MAHTTETVTVHDHPTTVRSSGDGPPVLFLHAEGNTSGWSDVHTQLAAHFTVIAPVHPGFGGEGIPPWLEDVSDMVFHYVDLLAVLGVEAPIVIGVGLGGWIGLDLAIHRSDLLSGLLLVGALGLRPSEPMPDLFLAPAVEALGYLASSIDAGAVDPLTGDSEAATALWVEQAAQARLMWERPYDPRIERRSHHVRCPVTVQWGSADRLLPVEHGRRLAAILDAEFTLADGAGHLVSLDAPAAVVAAVRALHDRRSS